MDWMSSVGDAVSGGFDTVAGFATDAFNWLSENPEAANMLGGIAAGVGQAYLQNEQAKDQRAFARDMYERKRRDRMAKPGEVNGYGSHLNTLAGKGLISSGMISGG
ncbi:hypothetical protein [Halomonas koreensis]|uniref:Uncharacterized protein n=1 Tax=Halomonas koreensis TaxID=245385 RepID=A0ABU1G4U5_9GAMM|nr:hypothetical protein [Halomonas koreensis]MDR5867920.1 hypothetical protein [Halomonas koreensis]